MSRYVDQHRERFGVEPVCWVLGVSASAYYQRATGRRSERSVGDERLLARIREVHRANYECYGYKRMWRALERAGEDVGRFSPRIGPRRQLALRLPLGLPTPPGRSQPDQHRTDH